MVGNGAAVTARGLRKAFGDVVAVDGIDLEVRAGTCLGVLGPNGAGKTTTIEILEGLTRPDAGEVHILGMDWAAEPDGIRHAIGVQLQQTEFQEKLSTRETLRLFRSFYREGEDVDRVLALVGLEEKRDAHVVKLSGGQKQRLAIGCALINRPRILFLDEPTTGLDPQARRRVWEIVEEFKAGGGTVLLTTHYMEEAERLADDLLIVDHGKTIATGTPPSIIASLGAESIIAFAPARNSDDVTPELDEAELADLPGVVSVRQDGTFVTLSVTATQDAIAGLFAHLGARGVSLEDLRTHRPTLEDVFVSMTGKHLRDE